MKRWTVFGFCKASAAAGNLRFGLPAIEEKGFFVTRALVLIVGFTLFAGLFVQSAPASKRLIVGIYDEAETLGRPERAFPMLQRLRAKAVRANLYWGGPNRVSRRRPARGTNPNDRS